MTRVLKRVALGGAILVAAGVLLSVCGFIGGGARHLYQAQNGLNFLGWGWGGSDPGTVALTTETLTAFHSIRVDGVLLDLDLRPSEDKSYGIALNCTADYEPPAYRVENGVLYVQSNWPHITKPNLGNRKYQAVLRYPSGTVFDSTSIHLDAGSIAVNGFQSESTEIRMSVTDTEIADAALGQFDFESDVGDLDLNDCTSMKASISLNIGDFEANKFDTDNLDVSVNIGSVDLSGAFRGETTVHVNIGDANLEPTLSSEQYHIVTKSTAEKRHSVGSLAAANQIDVSVNVGDANVALNDK